MYMYVYIIYFLCKNLGISGRAFSELLFLVKKKKKKKKNKKKKEKYIHVLMHEFLVCD